MDRARCNVEGDFIQGEPRCLTPIAGPVTLHGPFKRPAMGQGDGFGGFAGGFGGWEWVGRKVQFRPFLEWSIVYPMHLGCIDLSALALLVLHAFYVQERSPSTATMTSASTLFG